jgi:hypothetical protein
MTFRHDNVGSNFWNVNHPKNEEFSALLLSDDHLRRNNVSLMRDKDIFYFLTKETFFSIHAFTADWKI